MMFARIRSNYVYLPKSRRKPESCDRFRKALEQGYSRRSFNFISFPSDTTVLFFSNLYPEANASAAGFRTSYFLQQLSQAPGISSIHYATATSKTPPIIKDIQRELEEQNVHLHVLPPNRSEMTKEFLTKTLPTTKSTLVVFDRFYAEEMYSFHLHLHCPNALLVLDMQDMHSLRWARQEIIEQSETDLSDLPITLRPSITDTRLLRELASIHRCDLTLVCSSVELGLLNYHYGIDPSKLCLAPLFGDCGSNKGLDWKDRKDFVFVGGFRHEPNVDAVKQLKRLWPQIRSKLGKDVDMHIYGAYCPDQLKMSFHDPSTGFFVHGFHPSLVDILADKRCMLAPIRFGAGIKGKIVDAWKCGLPVVTTSIGSEGTHGDNEWQEWGGRVAYNDRDFCQAAVELYSDVAQWNKSRAQIPGLLSRLTGKQQWTSVAKRLVEALESKEERRTKDFTRGILWHQPLQSTEYFSKYIEYKERIEEKRSMR